MSKFTVIRLVAPRDKWGNPRSYYIVHDAAGHVVECYEGGYAGSQNITNQRHKSAWHDRPICFAVSVKELNRVLKLKKL